MHIKVDLSSDLNRLRDSEEKQQLQPTDIELCKGKCEKNRYTREYLHSNYIRSDLNYVQK